MDIGIEMKECPPGLGLFNNTCTCHVANPYGYMVLLSCASAQSNV